ncbi:MAG: peptide-methionine (R)-S-oxide reductase [Brevinema sp.]
MKKILLSLFLIVALYAYTQEKMIQVRVATNIIAETNIIVITNISTETNVDMPPVIITNILTNIYTNAIDESFSAPSDYLSDEFLTLIVTGGWDLKSAFLLTGVTNIETGFVGGEDLIPSIENVQNGTSDHQMSLKITYNTNIISHAQVLNAYFRNIDPLNSGYFYFQGKNFDKTIYYLTHDQYQAGRNMIEALTRSIYFDNQIPHIKLKLMEGRFYLVNEIQNEEFFNKNKNIWPEHLDKQSKTLDIWSKIPQSTLFAVPKYYEPRYVSDRIRNYFETVFPHADISVLKQKISSDSLKVIDEKITEPSFSSTYSTNTKHGIYVDIVTGEPLFSSTDQIHPSNGWVCFERAIDPFFLNFQDNFTFFYKRKEVRSKYANSHLGYLILNKQGGYFYRINGGVLRFIPHERMQEYGYGAYVHL